MIISLTIALLTIWLHECTEKQMIFHSVRKATKKLPYYLKKPLYDCPICSAIWWGPTIIAMGILGGIWQVDNIWELGIYPAAAGGINVVLLYLVNVCKDFSKLLKNLNKLNDDSSK